VHQKPFMRLQRPMPRYQPQAGLGEKQQQAQMLLHEARYGEQPPLARYRYQPLECLVKCQSPECGQMWDRDKNAALNILVRAKTIMHQIPLPAFWARQNQNQQQQQ
jgi:hypothetical protein